MSIVSRREMIGSLGTLVSAGGWLALTPVDADASPSPGGAYTLPRLPYAYDALAPHIDARTMELHHGHHHAGYVRGLNTALGKLEAARRANDFSSLTAISRDAAFNGSGHMLHSVFWTNMSPRGGGRPASSSVIARAIDRDFGGFDAFARQFTTAAAPVEGSGWGILAYEPIAQRLVVLQAEKHQNLSIQGAVPLLVVDVWEHAYYLTYQNRRRAYLTAFQNVIDWKNVDERLSIARRA